MSLARKVARDEEDECDDLALFSSGWLWRVSSGDGVGI